MDFAGGHGGLLVVAGELGRFGGDLLEDVVDERVHDGHGLGGDAGVRVHLLEDLVDVRRVRLHALLAALGAGALLSFGRCLGHFDSRKVMNEIWDLHFSRRSNKTIVK